jgi:hypothetical protein
MLELKFKQLQYEIDTLKRLLGFMTDENNHQKNRLSEFLKNHFEGSQLDELEYFQELFVKEDEQIAIIKNEVNNLEKILVREIFENGNIIRMLVSGLKNIRTKMNKEEKQQAKLKHDFSNYLSENILQIK